MRVALVGCGKAKLDRAAPARELYTGSLFRAAARWADRHADRWYVLSAKHGVVDPDNVLDPYNYSMMDLAQSDRSGRIAHPGPLNLWATRCRAALFSTREREAARLSPGDHVVLLAGAAYTDVLVPWLTARPWTVTISEPLRGKGIGQRLRWLSEESTDTATTGGLAPCRQSAGTARDTSAGGAALPPAPFTPPEVLP